MSVFDLIPVIKLILVSLYFCLIASQNQTFIMNFFLIKTIWANWELWILKACIWISGILTALYFNEILSSWIDVLWILFSITLVVALFLWFKKMKKNSDSKTW